MPYLMLAVAAIVGLLGFAQVARTPHAAHRVPVGRLLLWAVLLAGSVSIWLMAARVQ